MSYSIIQFSKSKSIYISIFNKCEMVKSKNLDAKLRLKIVQEEIENFQKLVSGHRKLLEAIGKM